MKENKFGLIAGFIFGLLTPFLSALGLVSRYMEMFGRILLYPGILVSQFAVVQTGSDSYSSAISMPLLLLINGIFYGLIGMLLQKHLRKKKYVALIFGGIIALIILVLVLESLLFGLSA
jgi:low temperature requirement protein LtrA